jgi:uncharacterized protein (TIGR02996 family)
VIDDPILERLWKSSVVALLCALVGFFVLFVTIALLVYFEHRTINTEISLQQGAAFCRSATPDRVDPANENQLVYLSGQATAGANVTDPEFGISVPALRLVREVELYQWVEEKTKDKPPKYTHKKIWSTKKPQQEFVAPQTPANPAELPYPDAKFPVAEVKVGAFTLTPAQVERLPADQEVRVTEEMLANLPAPLKDKGKIDPEGRLFIAAEPGHTPSSPNVGDVRVRFKAAKAQPVSVVARQKQSTFEPYVPEAGEKVDLIKPGQHSKESMFESAQSSNLFVIWFLRACAYVLLAIGLVPVLRRRAGVAAGAVPTGFWQHVGLIFLAGVLAAPLLLVVIGARWVLYQPVLGGSLLGSGLVMFVVLVFIIRRFKSGVFAGLFGGGSRTWSRQDRDYFRRIALDPHNVDLRLEFADHLEKKGDPLGRFIRTDQELEECPAWDEGRADLDRRWSRLLEQHGPTWHGPLRKLGLEPEVGGTVALALWMHHGILDEVQVERAGILPERADRLLAAVPGLRILEIRNIRIVGSGNNWKEIRWQPNIPAIVRLPLMKQIGVLRLGNLELDGEAVRAIASAPQLENVVELVLDGNELGPKAVAALARSDTLERLCVLYLRACNLGDAGAAALAQGGGLTGLRELHLGTNNLTHAGAAALAASAALGHIETLNLDGNRLGPVGAQAVMESEQLAGLTALNLNGTGVGLEAMPALARSPMLARLKTLRLSNNALTGDGLRRLAGSPHLGRLEVLELDGNAIDDAGVLALANAPAPPRLRELSLADNSMGDAAVKALARWAGLAQLRKLVLRHNSVGGEGVKALAASPHLARLEELDLSDNDLDFAAARALADSTTLSSLRTVRVMQTNLSAKAKQLLHDRFGYEAHVD